MLVNYQLEYDQWIAQEKKALELLNLVGTLWLTRSTELILFRLPLYNISIGEILVHHEKANQLIGNTLDIGLTLALTAEIAKLDLAPSRIDIGKLATDWLSSAQASRSLPEFVAGRLAGHLKQEANGVKSRDVILFGFGRIGRLLTRELILQAGMGQQLRLRAIVTRSYSDAELRKRAELLRMDSVHGPFKGSVVEDFKNRALIINGQRVFVIAAPEPEDVNYQEYGIENALLIDNTGVYRTPEQLGRHLKAPGVAKVLLTAPGSGDIPNIVTGINDAKFDFERGTLFSAASCTTNAIVPVLQVLDDKFGIASGHVETIHAYTNDQNLLDNYHKKERRGRSAALNMVITETGAAKAVSKVLPQLSGKLTGNAVRVPTPNVSLAILNLNFQRKLRKEELLETLQQAALFGSLVEQIDFSLSEELVSSDLTGNSHAAVVDGAATLVSPSGESAVVYVWYDNEYGYSRQVLRLAKRIARVVRLTYY